MGDGGEMDGKPFAVACMFMIAFALVEQEEGES
jgi:hypothetical protein